MVKIATISECGPAIFALPKGSVVVVVGGPDTYKTTFTRETIHQFLMQSSDNAVLVDSDIASGDLSVPGIVTVAVADHVSGMRPAREWPAIYQGFVGATSTRRHALDWLAATVAAVNVARKTLSGIVIVDTPSLSNSNTDGKLLRLLCQAIDPAMVLIFERKAEASALTREFERHSAPPVVVRVATDPDVGRKTLAVRQAARTARFSTIFRQAGNHVVPWSSVSLLSTRLTTGTPQPPQILKFIGATLKSNTLHAEIVPTGGLFAVVNTGFDEEKGRGVLEDHFKTRDIVIVPVEAYEHLLCGLVNPTGQLVDVALLESIDFNQRTLTLRTPLKRLSPIARMVFGRHRVMPDGREIGELGLRGI